MEETNEREVKRKDAHDAWERQMDEALPRTADVQEEARQVDQGSGDRQDEEVEERRREMFKLRTS